MGGWGDAEARDARRGSIERGRTALAALAARQGAGAGSDECGDREAKGGLHGSCEVKPRFAVNCHNG